MKNLLSRIALAACLALMACGAVAQEDVAAPITAESLPRVGLPGVEITLSGHTPQVPKGAVVKISLLVDTTPNEPGGEADEPKTHDVSPDANGQWTLTLSGDDTATLGRYAVTVTAPDGKGAAETTFDIVDGDAMGELLNATIAEMNASLDATENRIVVNLSDQVMALPDGEIKDDAVIRVNKIIKLVRSTRPHRFPTLPDLPPASPPEPGDTVPEPIDFTPVMEGFQQVTEESNRIREQMEKTRPATDNCMRMDALIETLNLTSSMMNFFGGSKVVNKPLDIAVNLLSDKILPAMMERQAAAKTQQEKNQLHLNVASMKLGIASIEKLQGIVKGVPGLVFDLTNHVTKYFYETYCTRFEGPFTATFSAEFYTDEGELYYHYIVKLGGLASLTQPKPQDNKAEPTMSLMRGRFDGQAIGYQVYQDALKLQPGLRSMLLFEKFIVPPERINLPPAEMGTMFNTMMHPLGFQIPIQAERQRDVVTLNFGNAAIRDMDPKIHRGLLVQVFAAGPIPAPNYQTFPMQDAYFILSRGMRSNAKFERKTVDGVEHLASTFHREETPAGIKLVWDVDVDMCNPGCTTTTIDRMKAWYDDYARKRDAGKKK